jgi:hypothetical protein
MRKNIFISLIVLVTVTFGFAQTKSKPTTRKEVSNPSKFMFLTVNGQAAAIATEPCSKNLVECSNERIGLYGYEGLGGPDNDNPKTETFTFKSGKKTIGIYLLTMKIDEDDSVAGERVRLAFERKGGKWIFVQAGKQNKCARGGNTTAWTKELCP